MADLSLTPDEVATLRSHEATIKEIRSSLDKLEKIGLDVTAERADLEQAETVRRGLLQQFTPSRRTL